MVGHPDVGAAVSDGIRESSIGLPADLGCGVIGIAWLSVTCSACLLAMLFDFLFPATPGPVRNPAYRAAGRPLRPFEVTDQAWPHYLVRRRSALDESEPGS